MYKEVNVSKRIIMTPGPVEAQPRVLRQMSQTIVGQFDPEFLTIMSEVKEMIKIPFGTKNKQAFAVDGTSRAGIEAALIALVQPGDKVLIPAYGRFAYLLGEICQRAQAEIIWLEKEWDAPFEEKEVIEAIKKSQPKIVAMIHGETANGQMQSLAEIGEYCRQNELFFIVDMVATYGGVELKVDDWNVDIAIAGTQKCVSVPSGLSLITYNERVEKVLADRYQKELGLGDDEQSDAYISSNYLDLSQLEKYWSPTPINHHTEATVMIYGLHEGLRLMINEGMENVIARHKYNYEVLRESFAKMNLTFYGNMDTMMPTVLPIMIPKGVDGEAVRSTLLREYGIEIASSFGSLQGKVWRVGNMGYSSQKSNILLLLSAFETVLKAYGHDFDYGAGSIHALQMYQEKNDCAK